jgi:hypothetical protein
MPLYRDINPMPIAIEAVSGSFTLEKEAMLPKVGNNVSTLN